ncbi:MAG: DUF2974 domain-containing protein [Candidatus Gastranaerophilales bacterium]|nr:DUF2974 domain-containing protein [Candidatus Gastranaerophilales bacterium]
MNNEIEKHKILKQASEYCYDINHRTPPAGYKLLGIGKMTNGFDACVLKNGNDIIIVFRGTELTDINYLKDDLSMLGNKVPKQQDSALDLYDKIHNEYPNCNITLTGHSLGGTLAQMVGAIRDVLTVTFNAFGAKKLLPKSVVRIFANKITNYCNPDDAITTYHPENHIGKCYKIYSSNNRQYTHHKTERMKPLDTRVPTTPEDLNYIKRQEHKAKEKAWEYYKRTGRHKPMNMSSTCVGSYTVSGYTKENGTKVSSYIRTCGAKHNK